jgi:hypothetical protein
MPHPRPAWRVEAPEGWVKKVERARGGKVWRGTAGEVDPLEHSVRGERQRPPVRRPERMDRTFGSWKGARRGGIERAHVNVADPIRVADDVGQGAAVGRDSR